MIYAQLITMPKQGLIDTSKMEVSFSFRWFGDEECVKYYENKLEIATRREKKDGGLKGPQETLQFYMQFFAENEFHPGPVSKIERCFYLPTNKKVQPAKN